MTTQETMTDNADYKIFGFTHWRTEMIPDEIPTLKQKTAKAWQKLQHMAIACNDLRWKAKDWFYKHPDETKNVNYALAAGTVGLLAGLTVIFGTEWLSKFKLPK